MAEGKKKCLSCGAVVSSALDVCPICGGRIFETGADNTVTGTEKTDTGRTDTENTDRTKEYHPEYHPEKENAASQDETLSWSPDGTEDTLQMVDFASEAEKADEQSKKTAAKPKAPKKKGRRTLRIVKNIRRSWRRHQKKKAQAAREEGPHENRASELKEKFDQQPPLTRRLIVIAACALALVIVLLVVALAIRSGSSNTAVAASPSATATATAEGVTATARADGEPIGTLTINDSNLINIRVSPDTESAVLGLTEESSYPVYAIQSDGTYTWYQIDTEAWIADAGGWITYTAN